MEHLKIENILKYIGGSEKFPLNQRETEGHLATCERCRRLFLAIMDFEKILCRSSAIEAKEGCPEDWEIASSVKQELDPAALNNIARHIEGCDYCLDRSAIYFKSQINEDSTAKIPLYWKQRTVEILAGESVKSSALEKIHGYIRHLFERRPSLPGYAVASASIVFAVVIIWLKPTDTSRIITIPSSERLAFYDSNAPASLAFMGEGRSRKVEKMKLLHKDGKLVLKWMPIDNVGLFHISIMQVSNGEKVIPDTTVRSPILSIAGERLSKNELYAWVITGETSSSRQFRYTGEFLLTE